MSRKHAQFHIWFGASAAIAAFAVLLGFVTFTAAHQAGFLVAEAERKLITRELDVELQGALTVQAEISFWDETIAAFQLPENESNAFWQDELVDWFTWDTDFQAAIVIDPSDNVFFAAELGEAITEADAIPYLLQNQDIIAKARQQFERRKVEIDGVSVMPVSQVSGLPDVAVGAYRYVDGEFGIVTAQVITSERGTVSSDLGGQYVLFGFMPLEATYVTDFAGQLGLEPRYAELAVSGPDLHVSPHMVPFPNAGEPPQVHFRWRPKRIDILIIGHIAPLALFLFGLLVIALYLPLRAHSKAVALLAKSEAANRKLANHDALTGLPNRVQFDQKLEAMVSGKADETFAVMCIDLDRFKAVNDTHGHNAGDAVLRTVADRLSDGIGDAGLLARVGGDEFVAIITKSESVDHLVWLGDALIDSATKPVMFGSTALQVGCSIGISIWPRHGRSAAEIIGAADRFLYESKRAGRGRVTIGEATNAVPSSKEYAA
ncbi:MAG: GGDEF domain-containing protein [Pseudomonadota bacterium]